ncbi:MAG: PHP domain-containing protein [Candidatus Hydrogenedentes bacterium]|nr:PHP domain-containing protein [Candidatus Hydrogenedentota bacterium]
MPDADFHLHSTCSDGADAPAEVMRRATRHGLGAVALTDHDTCAGNAEAAQAATVLGLTYVHGVEVSTRFEPLELHVIALSAQPWPASFAAALESSMQWRHDRALAIVEQLESLGLPMKGLRARLAAMEGEIVGRMHIAAYLTEAGVVKKPQEAFDRWLKPGCPGFVRKELLNTAAVIDLVHDAGGLAFVAHPGLQKNVRKTLPVLLELPFDGIEAFHVSHSPGRADEFVQLAQSRNLLITGGSDCHGSIKGQPTMGQSKLPWRHAARLLDALNDGVNK